MHGAKGEDIILKVPVGTQVLDDDKETVLLDMDYAGKTEMLLKGGNGGWGNVHFKGPSNQAPAYANPGQEGQERWIWLRLKLIADVGLAGLPNAGKSTFLAAVSAAGPRSPTIRSPPWCRTSAWSTCRRPSGSSSPTSPA
jgi:GTP-binding protein